MIQEYELVWLENKPTATGKPKAVATLKATSGIEEKNVTIWGNEPGFATLRPGHKVVGMIESKTDANNRTWRNLKIMSVSATAPKAAPVVKTPAEITAKSVEKSIDRKEDGIRLSATFRDATLLTVQWMKQRNAIGTAYTKDEWQTEWKSIRNWLDSKYDEPVN